MNVNAMEVKPPTLHWAIVLVLSIVTFGLFQFFWMLRQAQFARKIDPANRAVFQILLSATLFVLQILISAVVGFTVARGGEATDLSPMMNIMRCFEGLMILTAYFQIRATLTKVYGIKLNAVMTFFFNVYYMQYHMTRLAKNQTVPFAGGVLPTSQARSANA